ncbi:VOC family protein [Nocardia crassostreae]|uniref:VOC family protein n=1 Tax=Nocardia crassostreae TaxID=53428 RepID=UPI0008371F44|nr:glyoxalase/bleomycin resistance/dioxygenase family protein [Nocardia crassostreae]
MEMRRVCPLMIVEDTAKTLDWYAERGFDVVRDLAPDDLHLLVKDGEGFAQVMGAAEAYAVHPQKAEVPIGAVSGWFYLNLDDAATFIDSIIDRVEVVKDARFDFGRVLYFKDLNGYTIGVNQIFELG